MAFEDLLSKLSFLIEEIQIGGTETLTYIHYGRVWTKLRINDSHSTFFILQTPIFILII